ncbi:MAG: dihydrofolate reductase [Deltaproteobacteria bacterium]|nr:dihydrofolate reductase [Deltaproteobacteria bacterium]
MSQNRVIGRNNQLPWQLSEDLKRFKQITMGHPIIMGRKTFESIGKPLPGRENIVVTRSPDFHADGIRVVHSLAEALNPTSPPEYFVIGGAEIFKLALAKADKIYLTLIEDEFEGEALMPEFEKEFKILEESETKLSEKDQLPYRFITYHR